MKTVLLRALAIALGCLAFGCSQIDAREAPPRRTPLSERQGLQPAPAAKLDIGGDCSAFEGNQGCRSDLCLRLTPGFPPRGVCSQRCPPGDDTACPLRNGARWKCVQIWPSDEGWACAPPRPDTGSSSDGGAP